MTHDAPQTTTDRTRAVVQSLLRGDPPNGIAADSCGEWAHIVASLYQAHAAGGTADVRKMMDVLSLGNPRVRALVSGDATGGWGEIVSFDAAELPPFPLEMFPPWLYDFCAAVTETMQTPPDLAGMLSLAMVSAACARLFSVHVRPGWEEPVNVYTVTSLPPGSRKSPVFRALSAPIVAFEQDLITQAQGAILRIENERDILQEQLTAAKRAAAKEKDDTARDRVDELTDRLKETGLPIVPKLIVDDITPEALASALMEQGGRIAALSSEGDLFAIMAGRYSSGNSNLGVFLKSHPGDPLRVDRRERHEVVHHPALTIGITTQPDVLRSFSANSAFRGQGLLARFFYAIPKSTVGSRKIVTPPIPDEVRQTYHTCMRHLLMLARYWNSGNIGNSGKLPHPAVYSGDVGILGFISKDHDLTNYLFINEEGNNLLLALQSRLEPDLGETGNLGGLIDWASKLAGGVVRVAALLHMASLVSQNSHITQNADARVIPVHTLAAAIAFGDYLLAHARAAYAMIGADPATEPARVILRWIEKSGARTFTKRDCWQGVRGGVMQKADDLDPALALLADHGYIREVAQDERQGTGRKPSSRYEVHPRLASQNSHNTQNGGA